MNLRRVADNIDALAAEYADKRPEDILRFALQSFEKIAISFSGSEDVALIAMASHLAKELGRPPQAFYLDTGRLHPQTYRFIEKVRKQYDISLEGMSPDAERLQAFVRDKGLFSFYEDGHHECCGIRKREPLTRKLSALDAWITGQRRDQNPSTRGSVAVMEMDPLFATEDKPLIKFNPLAAWSSQQVWDYIRMFDVPCNELHNQGYASIGCEPCTRPIGPHQHEREGRWWWEEAALKECGLHQSSIIAKDK